MDRTEQLASDIRKNLEEFNDIDRPVVDLVAELVRVVRLTREEIAPLMEALTQNIKELKAEVAKENELLKQSR